MTTRAYIESLCNDLKDVREKIHEAYDACNGGTARDELADIDLANLQIAEAQLSKAIHTLSLIDVDTRVPA